MLTSATDIFDAEECLVMASDYLQEAYDSKSKSPYTDAVKSLTERFCEEGIPWLIACDDAHSFVEEAEEVIN